MKKNYISPAIESIEVSIQNLMDTSIKYDGKAPAPETGGEAVEGEGSDSRRHHHDIWDDETEEVGY